MIIISEKRKKNYFPYFFTLNKELFKEKRDMNKLCIKLHRKVIIIQCIDCWRR